MRILIVGINYAPEPVGIGPYTHGTATALREAGHEVEVLTAKPYYPAWEIAPEYARPTYIRSVEDGISVTRCPLYVPQTDGGLKRILHHLSFAAALLPKAVSAARRFRPELVLAVAPALISAPVARLAAQISGAKYWLHIQDFEAEAALATGLIDETSLLARAASTFERSELGRADVVSTISPQMCARLAAKGIAPDRIVEVRNWADIDHIRPLNGPSPYREEWAITQPHVAFYSGNIANKQGIGIVIEAAQLLQHRQDLKFVICGQGPNRAKLEQQAAGMGNVQIHDLQPRERLGDLLGLATVHLLPQLAGAADLVLPSKLANMMASGRPVVATAAPGTGIAMEVDGCGLCTPPGDAAEMAAAIERLIDNPTECEQLGHAGAQRAQARWTRAAALAPLLRAADGCGGVIEAA